MIVQLYRTARGNHLYLECWMLLHPGRDPGQVQADGLHQAHLRVPALHTPDPGTLRGAPDTQVSCEMVSEVTAAKIYGQ